jgi:phosphoribosylanthranilate isomerase
MTGVKVCGLCRPEDAAVAAAAGASHAGVILAAGGPRERSLDEAAGIFGAAAGLRRVGVFANRDVAEVVRSAQRLALDVVQLHGDESTDDVARIASGPWAVWKAIRPRTAAELEAAYGTWNGRVDALLVDGAGAGALGGTGTRAPWQALAPGRWSGPPLFVLAGGLRPENIADALASLDPDLVDVSSGVETSPGVKDPDAIRAFVTAALAAAPRNRLDGR